MNDQHFIDKSSVRVQPVSDLSEVMVAWVISFQRAVANVLAQVNSGGHACIDHGLVQGVEVAFLQVLRGVIDDGCQVAAKPTIV